MTTFSATTGGSGAISENMGKGVFRVYKTFDLAKLATDLNDGTAFTTNDVIEALEVPANTLVMGVHCKVHKAEGAACTIDVGDAGDADGFLNDVNINSTSTSVFTGHALGYGTDHGIGHLYTAADTIDITCNSAGTNAAVITLSAIMVDLAVHDYKP